MVSCLPPPLLPRYEVFTISRPATLLAALMHPLLRHYQARFARESMAAMAAQMAAAEGGEQHQRRGHGKK